MKNKKKTILLLCLLLFAVYVIVNFVKSDSPIDILEIQENTLKLTTGEKVQLTVKGYKHIDDKGNKKEVDISKLQISWRTRTSTDSFKVDEDGTLQALTTGIGNVQAVYKDEVYSRPITVWVSEKIDDNNTSVTYETNTEKILEILKYEEITSIHISHSTLSNSSIVNENDYILTNDEMLEFFNCFRETSLKEVEESYPATSESKTCYDISMYNKDGSILCLMRIENNNFWAFLSIANVIEERGQIAGWYEIVDTNIDKFIEKLEI